WLGVEWIEFSIYYISALGDTPTAIPTITLGLGPTAPGEASLRTPCLQNQAAPHLEGSSRLAETLGRRRRRLIPPA
ncbi:MAG: hypothetical protein ACRC2X_07430, partial [Giesbergeria sp.]